MDLPPLEPDLLALEPDLDLPPLFAPLEPVKNPLSVNVILLNVVLSLVADATTSLFKSSVISANTTIRAVEGVVVAVNVSDIKVEVALNGFTVAVYDISIPPSTPGVVTLSPVALPIVAGTRPF